MDTSTEDLGEVVFQRSAGKVLKTFVSFTFVIGLIAFLGLCVAGILAALEIRREGAPQMRGAGFMLLCSGTSFFLCGLFWLLLRNRANSTFVAFQYGVAVLKPSSVVRLRYDHIASMQCNATQVFLNGVYVNTGYAVILSGTDSGQPVNIRWSFQTRADDPELMLLPQLASRYSAKLMLERIMSGETVVWTKNLSLSSQGLVINTRKDPQLIPFANIGDAGLVMGRFEVVLSTESKPIVKENSHQVGFHSGFYAFGSLMTASGIPGMLGVEHLPWFEAGFSLV